MAYIIRWWYQDGSPAGEVTESTWYGAEALVADLEATGFHAVWYSKFLLDGV